MRIKQIWIFAFLVGSMWSSVSAIGWTDSALFSQKVFIENKGQFSWPVSFDQDPIVFAADVNGVEIYFSPNGLSYIYNESQLQTEKEEGSREGRRPLKKISHRVQMSWVGANPKAEILAKDVVPHYFTYGDLRDRSGRTSIKALAYKKIIYKDLYPGIDVEYIFPENKEGVKYSFILHPGADASLIQMKYSGDIQVSRLASGDLQVETSFGNIIDHAPESFYASDRSPIASSFFVKDNSVSFRLSGYDKTKTVVIDPWTTVPPLTIYNRAYEVDYDLKGNVYVYGGFAQYKEIKLNSAGVVQWVFTTNVFNSSAYPNNYGDCCVDRISGSSYIVEGYNTTIGARIIKVNSAGAQVAVYPGHQQFQEMWRVTYNNCTKKIIIAGGGPQMANQAALLDTNVATLTPVNVLNTTLTYQDMCLLALDNSNNCFMATVKSVWSFPAPFNNMIIKCPGTTLAPASYILPDGHTFPEDYNKTYVKITTGSEAGLGYNGMAVSSKYLYTYDGAVIKRWNKNTGALINMATINNKMFFNAGLEVDDCERIYVGVGKSVVTYDTTFTALSSVATADTVFDLKLGPNNLLYVSGISFVSSFQLSTTPCNTMNASVSGNGSCTVSSASVTVTGGTGPYTYYWSPGGQTTASVTGLAAGTYTVYVSDASSACVPAANIQTATITITPGAMSPSVITVPASCLAANGTATVSVNGGTAPYTYSWSPSGGNNATATGLSAGNYSVTVTDATGCSGTIGLTITQTSGITTTVTATSASCGGASGTSTASASSGTPPYTYNWSNGQTTQTASNLVSGNYSVTIADANGCTSTNTVLVSSTGSITASATNSTICAGQTALLSASGGSMYVWSNGSTGVSISVSPTSNTTYTVIVSSGSCSDTVFATVLVGQSPVAEAWDNVTITAGSTITLAASGGGNYLWSNGATDSLISVSPVVTTVYCVTVSYINGCYDTACVTAFIEKTDCGYADDQLFVPDAFSPNADGKNDKLGVYYPDISCIKELIFIVYDRWGEKVFEAADISVLWDGTYKSKPMNTAVFVYYMQMKFVNGNEVVRKGNISLIR